MGGGGKGGGTQTTTTNSTPWAPTGEQLTNLYSYLQPWLNGGVNPGPSNTSAMPKEPGAGTGTNSLSGRIGKGIFGDNADQYSPSWSYDKAASSLSPSGTGPDQYAKYNTMADAAKNSIASLDPAVLQAWNTKMSMAQDPNSAYNVAANEALKTAKGEYLNANPYLDRNVNTALDQVQSRVNSQFGLAGRTGSGANQDVMSRGMGDVASQMYGNNYQNERNRQFQAMGLAPQLANYAPDIMGEIGNQRMGYQQQLLNAPFTRLQQYASLIQPGLGFGTQTTTSPYQSNAGGGLGALLGAGVGGMFGGIPGATLGANLGGTAGTYLF